MAGPLENELKCELQRNSHLERIGEAFGERDDEAHDIASLIMDRRARPQERGIGAGMLEEQRRARTWKLILAAVLAVTLVKLVIEMMG